MLTAKLGEKPNKNKKASVIVMIWKCQAEQEQLEVKEFLKYVEVLSKHRNLDFRGKGKGTSTTECKRFF